MKDDLITSPELAKAVAMTTRGIFYYQSFGLIKPADKFGRSFVWTRDTIDRVKKIQEVMKTYRMKYIQEHLEILEG